MTLGNMRGVQHLIASCLNDACRHQALIDVSSYPADADAVVQKPGEVPAAGRRRMRGAGGRLGGNIPSSRGTGDMRQHTPQNVSFDMARVRI